MGRAESDTSRAHLGGPIVVASDATASASAALIAARLIASRTGADVEVLSVLEPPPAMVPSPEMLMPIPDPDPDRVARVARRLREQLRTAAGPGVDWTVDLRRGRPVPEIVRFARERGARLIITGLNRHGVLERLLGEETPLQLAQATDGPLLAVASDLEELPRCIIVALDLESPGIDRLHDHQLARALFANASTVYFMHVVPPLATRGPDGAYWDPSYGDAVRVAFERVKAELALPSHVHAELITPAGNPARQILDFASFVKVDLIVAGRRRRSALRRMLLGSVASRLLRGATCSVLLLPETAASPEYTTTSTEPRQWAERLHAFTHRNAGRRTTLQVDDAEIGAQAQACDYPLLGVDYDEKRQRIEIMLGERAGGTRHLTHSVATPRSIEMLTARDGSDSVLRIAYDGGYILLAFDH
jgi:nucleotide-binding universal stress UspA family protein